MAGFLDERVPIGFEWEFQLYADNAVIVVFGAAGDGISAIECDGSDRFRDRRAFEAQILRDGRNATGGWFGAAGLAQGAEPVEVDSLGNLVEEEDSEAAVK